MAGKNRKTIAELIRNFRSINIAAFIPPSKESSEFLTHLRRMGSRVEQQWPPPSEMPTNLDVVFVALSPLLENQIVFNWNVENPPAALIAVVDYENPLIVELALNLNVQATMGMPFRPFGVMIDVLLSLANFKRERKMALYAATLKKKLTKVNETEKAKSIVAQKYAVESDVAYMIIRKQAMNKRMSVETIVHAINSAHEILNLDSLDFRIHEIRGDGDEEK